jgi:hypothetical protein
MESLIFLGSIIGYVLFIGLFLVIPRIKET